MFSRIVLVLLFLSLEVISNGAAADDAQMDVSRWSFSFGIYGSQADTSMRVDGSGGLVGTVLDVEEFLNVEDTKNTGFFAGRFMFRQRHFLEVEYFNIGRNGRRVIDSSFVFDGETFDVGADIATHIGTEVYRLGYGYRFIQNETFILAASVGVHVTQFEASINALVSGGGGSAQGAEQFADVTAPLPVFGLSGGWQISDRLALVGRGQLLRLEINGIDGALTHGSIALEHDTFEHVGFGVGYDVFDLDVSAANSDWNGDVNFRFEGPMVFVKARF